MRPIGALFIYLLAVFVGGALLAPWLYGLMNLLGLMDAIGSPPFHKFVTRCLLLVALAGMWPLLRFSGMDSWRAIGLARTPGSGAQLARGCLAGFGSLGIVAAGALATGARAWDIERAAPAILLVVVGALTTAGIVAVLEEILFRGAFFGTLRRGSHWLVALVISSAIYSVVHFFKRAAMTSPEVKWSSGLELLPKMLRGFTDPQQIVPGFFVLLLAGSVLAVAYQRTGSLYFSIGLHAGWIFLAQSYAVFTKQVSTGSHPFWGSARIIDGWCGVIMLAPFLFWFFRPAVPQRLAQASGARRDAAEPLTRGNQ